MKKKLVTFLSIACLLIAGFSPLNLFVQKVSAYTDDYKPLVNPIPSSDKYCNIDLNACRPDYWDFYIGQCTSYVAWRMNRDHGITDLNSRYFYNSMTGPNGVQGFFGAAATWFDNAKKIGFSYDGGARPGDIAWFYYGTDSKGNVLAHVAYVESVNADGTVNVTQYNAGADPVTVYDADFSYQTNLTATHYIHVNNSIASIYRPSMYGDFDGNGKKDLTFLTPNGTQTNWNSLQGYSVTNYPQSFSGTLTTELADFDKDGITDYGLYNKTTGYWNIVLSGGGTLNFKHGGATGDIALAGDVDGDHKAEEIIYRPSDGGHWYYTQTSNGAWQSFQHGGASGDIPVLANFDGTGLNPTIFRPSEHNWYERKAGGTVMITKTQSSMQAGDIPVPADVNGYGTDLVTYRPNGGWWNIVLTNTGQVIPPFQNGGASGDIPIAGDFNGDGRDEVGIVRPSEGTIYYVDYLNPTKIIPIPYAKAGSNDVAGTGKFTQNSSIASAAVFRQSEAQWYVAKMTKLTTLPHGTASDQFVPGKYSGSSADDRTIFRTSEKSFYSIFATGINVAIKIPEVTSSAVAIPGDYDGDGKTDFAVWDQCIPPFPTDQFCWYYLPSSTTTYTDSNGFSNPTTIHLSSLINLGNHGGPGDIPVPGNYDVDKDSNGNLKPQITDRAIFRVSEGTWYIYMSSTGHLVSKQHGSTNPSIVDIPIAADINQDGRADLIIYRAAEKSYYYYLSSGAEGFASSSNAITFTNATTSDLPVIGKYDDDQLPDFGVFNAATNRVTIMFSNISMNNLTESFWIGNLINAKPL